MSLPSLVAPPNVGYRVPKQYDLAPADRMAVLSPAEREKVLAEVDTEALLHDYEFWARPSQRYAIESDSRITAILSGRGFGKTWVLSMAAHRLAKRFPGSKGAVIGRTVADIRTTMVLGDSGIMNTVHPEERPRYVPNNREVTWPNGTVATTFPASTPDLIRGPQFHWAICDEVAAWPHRPPSGSIANAWDNVNMATRLGDNPQIFVATTPRRVPSIVNLLNEAHTNPAKVRLVRGPTSANRHLAQVYHDTVVAMYAGTHLGMQELEGELLGDVEGALWTQAMIDRFRLPAKDSFQHLAYPLRVVGVDPTVAEHPRDECGIVAVAATRHRNPFKRKAVVLGDFSLRGSPQTWARRAVAVARDYGAIIVAEDNQGGELVRTVIKAEDPTVPVVLARSQASKAVRAEPVVLSYERGQVAHYDYFGELESQQTGWVPDESDYSPDRLDALVIAVSATLVNPPSGLGSRLRVATGTGGQQTSQRALPPAAVKVHQRTIQGAPKPSDLYRPRARVHYANPREQPGEASAPRRRQDHRWHESFRRKLGLGPRPE